MVLVRLEVLVVPEGCMGKVMAMDTVPHNMTWVECRPSPLDSKTLMAAMKI